MTTPSQSYYPKHNMQNHDGYIGASGSEADASTTTPAEQCRVGLSIADLISDDENEHLDRKSNGPVLEEVERDLSGHDEHIDMDSHSGSTVDRSSELLPTSLGESVKHHMPDAGSSRDESHPHETFFGFIKEPMDALLIVEACIRGILVSVDKVPSESSEVFHIRSGSIVVFQESSKRWRDGRKWSPSRVHGPFLLYREVEPTKRAPEPRKSKPTHILDTRIPGLEPTYSFKTLKQNTRLVPDGLTKRTITLKGSDGIRHRVISYYARDDVINMYAPPIDASSNEGLKFRTPSETPQLNSLLNDSAIDLKALLAESIDMEKYASEMAIAKKQRKEETIKAVARHAFGYEDDDGEGDIRGSNVSPAKRTKRPTSTVSPSRRRPSEEVYPPPMSKLSNTNVAQSSLASSTYYPQQFHHQLPSVHTMIAQSPVQPPPHLYQPQSIPYQVYQSPHYMGSYMPAPYSYIQPQPAYLPPPVGYPYYGIDSHPPVAQAAPVVQMPLDLGRTGTPNAIGHTHPESDTQKKEFNK